jgi:hypothetical protein
VRGLRTPPRRSRAFLGQAPSEFTRATGAAFRPAPVPTTGAPQPAREMPGRGAVTRRVARPCGRDTARSDAAAPVAVGRAGRRPDGER